MCARVVHVLHFHPAGRVFFILNLSHGMDGRQAKVCRAIEDVIIGVDDGLCRSVGSIVGSSFR